MRENEPIEIELEERGASAGRYVYRRDGLEAELTFTREVPHEIRVNHTFVPQEWRNKGIAAQLVLRVVEDARRQGFKIRPICPYVVVAFRRHPELADVLA